MADQLSDETWRSLDPYAGRLSTPEARRLLLIVLSWVLVVLVGFAVALSGVVVPRLTALPVGESWPAGGGSAPPEQQEPPQASARAHPDAGTVVHGTTMLNHSWLPARVSEVTADVSGLELVDVEGLAEPLRHGERREVRFIFRVSGCAAVPPDPWPVRVTVARPWGEHSVELRIGTDRPSGGPTNDSLTRRACGRG